MPQFSARNTKMCTNYQFMGGIHKHGKRKTLPKKVKLAAIMYVNPKVWNPLRVSMMTEEMCDYMCFLLFAARPNCCVTELLVNTKGAFWEMMLEEHIRVFNDNANRTQNLAADLSNCKQLAINGLQNQGH